MADQMFRIVKKTTGEIEYYEQINSCNKAKMVERAKKWCSHHHFKDEAAVKDYVVEFSYFTWDSYYKGSSRRRIGYSNYDYWRCTTICNLEQKDGHLSIGSLVAGKALDPDTAKKAKGGAWGELMIDTLGC